MTTHVTHLRSAFVASFVVIFVDKARDKDPDKELPAVDPSHTHAFRLESSVQ
jgi:hypothetical protein